MTAAEALVICDFCNASMAAGETFQPIRGGAVNRCRDVAACERRQLRGFDPTLLPAEDRPVPPTTAAPRGASCAICGVSGAGLYERIPHSGQWVAGTQQHASSKPLSSSFCGAGPIPLPTV